MRMDWTNKYEGVPEGKGKYQRGFKALVVDDEDEDWDEDEDEPEQIKVETYSVDEQDDGSYEVWRIGTKYEFGDYFSANHKVAEGVTLSEGKRLAEEDMEMLLKQTEQIETAREEAKREAERKIAEAERKADAERQAALTGFNSLFDTYGKVIKGYDGPVRSMAVELADGTSFSVIAGEGVHSSPSGVVPPFTGVEIGYPTREIPALNKYVDTYTAKTPTQSIYKDVPVEVIEKIMLDAGGYSRLGQFPYERVENPAVRKLKTKLLR